MKKITQLDKNEKRMLLKSIATGEIDRKTLTPETHIAIKRGDWFLGLMMQSGNENLKVVCIGEAKAEQKTFASFKELPALNFDRIESSGLYKCKETGEELTSDQVKAMEKDYLLSIEVIDRTTNPASSYHMIPRSKEMFINDLQKQ
jgi:hypothetical protein